MNRWHELPLGPDRPEVIHTIPYTLVETPRGRETRDLEGGRTEPPGWELFTVARERIQQAIDLYRTPFTPTSL
jgi:hypothetical protein